MTIYRVPTPETSGSFTTSQL